MILQYNNRPLCLLVFTALLLGGWATVSGRDALEPIYGTIESIDTAAQRIKVNGETYAFIPTALIRWPDGRDAKLSAAQPGMRVAIELVDATGDDPVPWIRVLTLRFD